MIVTTNKFIKEFHSAIKAATGRFPEVDKPVLRYSSDYMEDVRTRLVRRYAWSIPTQEVINEITTFVARDQYNTHPIIEVGAGTGFWAACLQEGGLGVHPFDLNPPDKGNNEYKHNKAWTYVSEADHEVLEAYESYWVLLLCWPPCDDPFEINAFKAFRGNQIIYVGETEWGCTGTDEGKAYLKENFTKVKAIDIPQFEGIHDQVTLWERK